ncbi:MAG: hypothetical protein IKC95_00930 [Oscillospiraceae bacterium]|nr:hypothetical protein [Oscillospiraceae bacterium]
MIGSGLSKFATKQGMKVSQGVAYGSLMGLAVTLSEGSGYKQMVITTKFSDPAKQVALQESLDPKRLQKVYRVTNLQISTGRIIVTFHDTIGTMDKIIAFTEWFMPLLHQHSASGADICSECGQPVSGGSCWKLINGTAYHMHELCAQKVLWDIEQSQQKQTDADTGSYFNGTIGAILGMLIGAVAWGFVLAAGYLASLVGLAMGWLSAKGYDLFRGKQGKGKVAILIVCILVGVLLGTVLGEGISLYFAISAGELPFYTPADIPALLIYDFTYVAEYRIGVLTNVGLGLLFAGLGVFALLRNTAKSVSGTKVKHLD